MIYGDALIVTQSRIRQTVTKEFETMKEAHAWRRYLMHRQGVLELDIRDEEGDLIIHIDSECIENYTPDGRLRRREWRR